jgi:hypothetical protein
MVKLTLINAGFFLALAQSLTNLPHISHRLLPEFPEIQKQ